MNMPIAPVRRERPVVDPRDVADVMQWCDEWNGVAGFAPHPDRNVYERYRVELCRMGLDRTVRGSNWAEAYEKAARLVRRNPELKDESEDDE